MTTYDSNMLASMPFGTGVHRVSALLLFTLLVATGCGGGGGDAPTQVPSTTPLPSTPPPTTANPVVTYSCAPRAAAVPAVLGGTISLGGVDATLVFFGSASGQHVLVYGRETGSSFEPVGMTTINAADCTGSDGSRVNGWDSQHSRQEYREAFVQATYDVAMPVLSGSIQSTAGTTVATFSGGSIPGATYDYNTAADVQAAVGDWVSVPGSSLWTGNSMSIRTDGSVTVTTTNGTKLIGMVAPAASGKNVLDLRLHGLMGWESLNGQLVVYSLAGGGSRAVGWAIAYEVTGDFFPLYITVSRP